METITVDSLKTDVTFTGDLLIDSSFILLPHTAPVTKELIKALKTWGYESILCDGNISLGGDIGVSTAQDETQEKNSSGIGDGVKKAIESSRTQSFGSTDQARMEMVESVYTEYMDYIEGVLTYYTTHKEINKDELSETVKELCSFIKDHRRYMLRINPTTETSNKNFLVIHSMRTTVLALAIAMNMHIPLSKMIELGVSCILHEIGMLRLPPQLYMTDKRLSASEKAQITKHTLFGYQIIKTLNFPTQITEDILNHHENMIGTGYPRRLQGENLSTNAKIIQLACSYEAISSIRSYKNERTTFEAIVELIQNKEKKYDDVVVKALLYTVSFYPIGSYVFLSNRKVALVIDVNPANVKNPIVQLLTERDKDGDLKIITTGENDISVERILTKSEKNDILKALENKANVISAKKEQAKSESETEPAPKAETVETPFSSTNADGEEEVDISFFN